MEFNVDILFVEYESFSCRFNITAHLDKGFCIEYESFSFDPLIPHDSFLVEYESFCFDINVSLAMDLCADYESFSFGPSKLNSSLNLTSLTLLSLRALSLNILI